MTLGPARELARRLEVLPSDPFDFAGQAAVWLAALRPEDATHSPLELIAEVGAVRLRASLRLLLDPPALAAVAPRWELAGSDGRFAAVVLQPGACSAEAAALAGALAVVGAALAAAERIAAQPCTWSAPLAALPPCPGWELREERLPEVAPPDGAVVDLRLRGEGSEDDACDVALALQRAYQEEGRPVGCALTFESSGDRRWAVAYVGAYRLWRPA